MFYFKLSKVITERLALFVHQGGKIFDDEERNNMYSWLDDLEFKLLRLPKPDICIFLHMPYEAAVILKSNRSEAPDQNEANS